MSSRRDGLIPRRQDDREPNSVQDEFVLVEVTGAPDPLLEESSANVVRADSAILDTGPRWLFSLAKQVIGPPPIKAV